MHWRDKIIIGALIAFVIGIALILFIWSAEIDCEKEEVPVRYEGTRYGVVEVPTTPDKADGYVMRCIHD